MHRVTLDTNVIISALNYPGAPFRLLDAARQGAFRMQISDAILAETCRILGEAGFGWPQERIAQARRLIGSFAQHVTPHVELDVVKRDPDDNRVLECSQASRSDYIVTSDKDLLDLRSYAGAGIMKPLEYLDILKQRKG